MAETVFVLGAGFSSPAAILVQNEIMKNIPKSFRAKSFYNETISLSIIAHILAVKCSGDSTSIGRTKSR